MTGATLSLIGALVATAAAQVTYKAYSLGGRRLQLYATVLLFGLTPVLTYVAVKAFGIGLVYIATSVTYILVAAAGWFFFAERPSMRRVAAMGFILSGILIYGLGL